jgi:hypothetical protein
MKLALFIVFYKRSEKFMAYEFKKLSDVEALTEVPENATVLAEVNGAIKRIPGNGLGGSSSGLVISLDLSGDNETFKANSTANMTLADAMAAFQSGTLGTPVIKTTYQEMPVSASVSMCVDCSAMLGADCLGMFMNYVAESQLRLEMFYWSADGFSMDQPSV